MSFLQIKSLDLEIAIEKPVAKIEIEASDIFIYFGSKRYSVKDKNIIDLDYQLESLKTYSRSSLFKVNKDNQPLFLVQNIQAHETQVDNEETFNQLQNSISFDLIKQVRKIQTDHFVPSVAKRSNFSSKINHASQMYTQHYF